MVLLKFSMPFSLAGRKRSRLIFTHFRLALGKRSARRFQVGLCMLYVKFSEKSKTLQQVQQQHVIVASIELDFVFIAA